MRSVTPSIESAVSRLAPGFRALSIVVESAPVADPAVAEQRWPRPAWRCSRMMCPGRKRTWLHGMKRSAPSARRRNVPPCSAQALRKRVLKEGSLPAIDPVVDIYNAISIRYARPGRWGKSGRLPWRTAAGHCPRR
ncbi:B3/4 domain-containing protein [Klebsiella pneumoniae subsp. pneumoniae]|uniref:B3/4 domain-containing protein n=1 Tax=Klebsiella pneumoniae subsp. pneumoniae TaxID=72407 RepID=A0A377Z500_KLEPN|nr:B3/4 domain-containing protein [Klebsiella pneumoniae subsp. pneumoniae]